MANTTIPSWMLDDNVTLPDDEGNDTGTKAAEEQSNDFTTAEGMGDSKSTMYEESDGNKKSGTDLYNIAMYLPSWGYSDFMQERLNWQKGLNDVGGEPGWFYFRIFFHFNTASGLFGGQIQTNNGNVPPNRTCAKSFFKAWSPHYPTLDMGGRSDALETFCNMLNNISNNTPWFFKSISGMDKANVTSLNEPFKDNTLEIKCLVDGIDMRLNQLFEYYKYACFDYINYKEILPENLRKFDMSVVVFGVPIRYLDTHAKINGREFYSRSVNGSGNGMTMAMYTFKDCEFDIENMTEPNNSDMSNEHAFQSNNVSIKIKYKKVFNYKRNGFNGMAISNLGNPSYSVQSPDMRDRLSKLAEAYTSLRNQGNSVTKTDSFIDKFISNKTQFSKWYKFARGQGVGSASKALIDETEAICQDYYHNVSHTLYNTVVGKGLLGAGELGSITPPDHGVNTDYYKEGLKKIHVGAFRPARPKGVRGGASGVTGVGMTYKDKLSRLKKS